MEFSEKGGAGLTELHEQIDQVQRLKNRAEKERSAYQRQLEMAQSQLDDDSKQRMEMDRRAKQLEGQLLELRLKTDEQSRQLQAILYDHKLSITFYEYASGVAILQGSTPIRVF